MACKLQESAAIDVIIRSKYVQNAATAPVSRRGGLRSEGGGGRACHNRGQEGTSLGSATSLRNALSLARSSAATETRRALPQLRRGGYVSQGGTEPRKIKCRICDVEGHLFKDCEKPDGKQVPQLRRRGHVSRGGTEPRKIKCRICDVEGHLFKDCEKPDGITRIKCKNSALELRRRSAQPSSQPLLWRWCLRQLPPMTRPDGSATYDLQPPPQSDVETRTWRAITENPQPTSNCLTKMWRMEFLDRLSLRIFVGARGWKN
ncbi:zinc knuckle [Colletotrichum scovillei]|nr:zinc knuckle [Colletotrichum scovillei]